MKNKSNKYTSKLNTDPAKAKAKAKAKKNYSRKKINQMAI